MNNYRITVLTDSLIRMEYASDGEFTDEKTQIVVNRDFPTCEYRVMEKEDSLEIVTKELHLYYDKKEFSPEGLRIQLKEGFHIYCSVWHFGDKVNDLKGTARTLDCVDGETELEPGILSREGYTVLDDSRSAILHEDGWISPRKEGVTDLYFFGYGHRYLECLKDFYHLTGETPLLPRYALGNWWSRFYRYTEKSYLELMDRFQSDQIPFSVAVIDMDWHLTDIPKEFGSGWTGYTWNKELFPDPKRFMGELHKRGMKVTLNVHPADGVRGHEDAYIEMAKELGIDYEKKDKIPFDITNQAFLKAYFKYLHHPNEEDGVDFWWIDWQQGMQSGVKGLDPLWMLNHYHFEDLKNRGKEPLIFSRYAGIGSHRYPVGFSGDTFATWDSLDFQPYFTANASNVGYSWWSHDIGGHMGGKKDDEMVTRWIQFGVFSPIMRLHSTCNEFYGKEPWNYGMEASQIMVKFLQLRHRLIPYIYSMNYLTHCEGLPLVCPMYYYHDTWDAYEMKNEYYFGTQMIACPITRPMDKETLLGEADVWLPEGQYYDFFTGQVYRGGRKRKVYRELENMPVFVKAGGIIPMAKDFMKAHISEPEELEVMVFHGADGAFTLYEEQGETVFTYQNGTHAVLTIEKPGHMKARSYEIVFRGIDKPTCVMADGSDVTPECVYDSNAKTLRAKADSVVELWMDNGTVQTIDGTKRLYELLHRAQISYETKRIVYEAVQNEADAAGLLTSLYEKEMPGYVQGLIFDTLYTNS